MIFLVRGLDDPVGHQYFTLSDFTDDVLGVPDLPGLAEDKGSRGCRGIGWVSPAMTSR